MSRSAHESIARPTLARWATLAVLIGLSCGTQGDSRELGTPGEAIGTDEQAATTPYDWLQYYGNATHSGNNTLETTISSSNVGTLTQLFKVALPAIADGAPAVLTNVSTSSGTRDLLFVTTQAGHTLALDAHTGATIWSHQNTGSNFTTSSPAVDPARNFVYSYGLDGKIHKYAVGSGTETTTGGWPEVATLKPSLEKGSTSLAIATSGTTSFIYIGYSGYGDGGDYQGHLTAVNLNDGSQKVFNADCSNQTVHFVTSGTPDCPQVQSAVWGRSGVIYLAANNRIYSVTGNGVFNPSIHSWGDSIVALNPDGTGVNGNPVDSYTPTTFQTLQDQDLDLGSAVPAILPNSGTKFPHIALHGGKDQTLRIVNLDNLSGQGGPGHTGGELFSMTLPQGGDVTTGIPTWTNPADNSTWVYVSSNSGGLAAFTLVLSAAGDPSLTTQWTQGTGGGSVLIANNVLYRVTSNNIRALNPTTGAQLWSNTGIGAVHWQSPVVANGVLYVEDNSNQLTAFTLPSSSSSPLPRTGWVASASATHTGEPPSNALDGNSTTRWSTGAAQTNGQWFQVDMTGAKTFNKLTLDAGTSTGDFPHGYQVFVSNDGVNFGSAIASGSGSTQLVTITFPQQTARYVKIVQTGSAGNWWSIHELNVYGTLTALSRTGWVTSASSTGGTDVPSRAIDGNLSTRWSTGAAQTNGQWFLVDMTASKTFSEITLDAGTSTGDYPRGWQVFVSSDGTNFGSAIASGTGSTQLVTITFATQTARYIKIVQTGSAGNWWSIHELNVVN